MVLCCSMKCWYLLGVVFSHPRAMPEGWNMDVICGSFVCEIVRGWRYFVWFATVLFIQCSDGRVHPAVVNPAISKMTSSSCPGGKLSALPSQFLVIWLTSRASPVWGSGAQPLMGSSPPTDFVLPLFSKLLLMGCR